MKKIKLLSIALASIFLLSACSNHNDKNSSVTKNKQVLNVGLGNEVNTLDPAISNDLGSGRVINDLYEGLVTYNQANKVIPGVAKSWSVSDNGLVYTFHLRKDAKWSNGQPVTAGDFVFSFKRAVDPKTGAPNSTMLDIIKNGQAIASGKANPSTLGIKAINPTTLQITLEHPEPYFITVLTSYAALPVYPQAVKNNPKGWAKPSTLVTDGAYKIDQWVPNGHLSVKRNTYYWDNKGTRINQVNFFPINSPSDQVNRYNAGDIDMTFSLPLGATAQQYKKKYGKQFVIVSQLANSYFVYNVDSKNFSNVKVRKALSMVVDRKAMINAILRMGQTPSYGIVADDVQQGLYKNIYKSTPGYKWVDQPMNQRIKEAKKLLQEAGYNAKNPLRVVINISNFTLNQQTVQVVMQMWKNAFGDSIKVSIDAQESKVHMQAMAQGNFQITLLGWYADYNQATNYIDLFSCGSSNNYGNFCNQQAKQEYKAAMYAKTPQAFNQKIGQTIKTIMEQYPSIPLYNATYSRLVKPYIGGYIPQTNHIDFVKSQWFYFKTNQNTSQNS